MHTIKQIFYIAIILATTLWPLALYKHEPHD